MTRISPIACSVLACLILAACGGDSSSLPDGDAAELPPADAAMTPTTPASPVEVPAEPASTMLSLQLPDTASTVIEGDDGGVSVSVIVQADSTVTDDIRLSAELPASAPDGLVVSFGRDSEVASGESATLTITQSIGVLPRLPGTLDIEIVATAGSGTEAISVSSALTIAIEPVDAPDVYLLVGQSNMVGFSGDGTRMARNGEPDAPDSRILQLHVTPNDRSTKFQIARDFADADRNINDPILVEALDPLHVPYDNSPIGKEDAYIGLGLSFAKEALASTTQRVVLVPAAWSGTSFCASDSGRPGNWNAQASTDPALGDTLLFERAVTRTNIALAETGGILRGILWHQGESDANEACAASYADNLSALVDGLRSQIDPDAAGDSRRGAEAAVPFVIGTMSRGIDSRGDLSVFGAVKQQIDDAHRSLADTLPFAALSNHDDLVPANGYLCGNTSCIHFGAEALRVMGSRYHDALVSAARVSSAPPQ